MGDGTCLKKLGPRGVPLELYLVPFFWFLATMVCAVLTLHTSAVVSQCLPTLVASLSWFAAVVTVTDRGAFAFVFPYFDYQPRIKGNHPNLPSSAVFQRNWGDVDDHCCRGQTALLAETDKYRENKENT